MSYELLGGIGLRLDGLGRKAKKVRIKKVKKLKHKKKKKVKTEPTEALPSAIVPESLPGLTESLPALSPSSAPLRPLTDETSEDGLAPTPFTLPSTQPSLEPSKVEVPLAPEAAIAPSETAEEVYEMEEEPTESEKEEEEVEDEGVFAGLGALGLLGKKKKKKKKKKRTALPAIRHTPDRPWVYPTHSFKELDGVIRLELDKVVQKFPLQYANVAERMSRIKMMEKGIYVPTSSERFMLFSLGFATFLGLAILALGTVTKKGA